MRQDQAGRFNGRLELTFCCQNQLFCQRFGLAVHRYLNILGFIITNNLQVTIKQLMLDNPKIIGKLSLPIVLCVYIPIMLATPLYTYHMAVSSGQQKPFPHATVTSTAEHYPQNIVFRFIMLFCSSLLALTFYCAFRWIQYEAIRVGYPLLGKWLFYLAEGSILCYGLTIGTIDGNGGIKLHDICAVIFFVVWMVTILTMTVYIRKLRNWDTSVLSRSSMTMKLVLAIYITAIWIWCIYGLITTSSNKKSDKYVVILEWNSVMINLLWVFTMVFEWKKFSLALTRNK